MLETGHVGCGGLDCLRAESPGPEHSHCLLPPILQVWKAPGGHRQDLGIPESKGTVHFSLQW